MRKKAPDPREAAEIVAIQALSFLASQGELLAAFLSETGIGPQTLRASASDPRFLAQVLDFILRNDKTVEAFSASSEHHPTTVMAARQALDDPRWERDVP